MLDLMTMLHNSPRIASTFLTGSFSNRLRRSKGRWVLDCGASVRVQHLAIGTDVSVARPSGIPSMPSRVGNHSQDTSVRCEVKRRSGHIVLATWTTRRKTLALLSVAQVGLVGVLVRLASSHLGWEDSRLSISTSLKR